MNKAQLIEAAQRDLCGGTPTPEQLDIYHPEVIAIKIALLWEAFLSEVSKKNPADLDNYAKLYDNSGSGILISFDSNYSNYYSLLPDALVNITGQPMAGIRSIEAMKGRNVLFTPISSGQGQVLRGLDVWAFDDTIPYFVDFPTKVVYDKKPYNIKRVKMRLLVPFEKLDDSDDISVPGGQGAILFDMLKKSFAGVPSPDLINDNNPKTA